MREMGAVGGVQQAAWADEAGQTACSEEGADGAHRLPRDDRPLERVLLRHEEVALLLELGRFCHDRPTTPSSFDWKLADRVCSADRRECP